MFFDDERINDFDVYDVVGWLPKFVVDSIIIIYIYLLY